MSRDVMLGHKGIGVLVVDDDPVLRRMVTMVLQDEGWHVLQAQDGAEALAALRSNSGHLVALIDGRLPKMSGEEVLLAVRADPQLRSRHAYVLMSGITPEDSPHLMNLLHELSASALTKPFAIENVLSTIECQARRLVAVPQEAG